MTFRSLVLAGALVIASATAGSAATYHLGDVTGGASTTKTLKVQTVDFLTFTLDAPSDFRVSAVEISVTSTKGSNFSEMIGLFSNSRLIATASAVRGGGNTATLSFSGLNTLADGTYTLGVAGWKAYFTQDIADARSTAFFRNGSYTVTISPTISPVPLPAGGLLMLTGLGGLVLARRKGGSARG
jgi:hypothetical protein